MVFTGLSPALYTLRVVATNRRPDKEFIKTRFEITDDAERCTLHLINGGVVVSGDSARVEFTGRGPAAGYLCHLDKTPPYMCMCHTLREPPNNGRIKPKNDYVFYRAAVLSLEAINVLM